MDEEEPYCPVEAPAPAPENVEHAPENVGQSTESASNEVEGIAPVEELEESPILDYVKEVKEETKNDSQALEPPLDWFEPLEDDDYDDGEEGSLGGESEISLSVGTSEKKRKRVPAFHLPRGKRSHPDEGWEEWPLLGEGWKRKAVVRRSGSSIGQKDVYYLSPRGDRVRSRVELVSLLDGVLDMSQFDYKSGVFLNEVPKRRRKKKKLRERSSSESSWLDRGEGAETPDSIHRLTPNTTTKNTQQNQTLFLLPKHTEPTVKIEPPNGDSIKLPLPSAARNTPLPAINGEAGNQDSILECAKCGISFTGTKYDRKRKRPCCASCWALKTKEHPMIRFRKWIPCGQCMGCLTTVNCGQCANCRNGFQSAEPRRRVCNKRKCSCPIRKGSGVTPPTVQKPEVEEVYEDISNQYQPTPSLKGSDTENISISLDLDLDLDEDEEISTDDDDDWHKKRKRRSCGECKACLCRRDCGTCDFCIDKPKFGGSNKKRQKCRLRQCQRQAMRHLLPAEMEIEYGADSMLLPGRPRPHYTYSRKSTGKKNKPNAELDLSDNEDDDTPFSQNYWRFQPEDHDLKKQHSKQVNKPEIEQLNGVEELFSHANIYKSSLNDQLRKRNDGKTFKIKDGQKTFWNNVNEQDEREDDEDFPMITHIFSLAEQTNGTDSENQLANLFKSLQETDLPVLWYAIMVDGPLLQLIQCSKQSNMADTMVLIDPAFHFQIRVQKQPLLPTHWLYDDFPPRLNTVGQVVTLLATLEKYSVCNGLPPKDTYSSLQPVTLDRAAACYFVVKRNVAICSNCKLLAD